MKDVRLWEFDNRSLAHHWTGFGHFMGAGGCTIYRMLGFHLIGAINNVCIMSGVAFLLAS